MIIDVDLHYIVMLRGSRASKKIIGSRVELPGIIIARAGEMWYEQISLLPGIHVAL